MATIRLRYGRQAVEFNYDEARFQLLAPSAVEGPLTDGEMSARLDQPFDAQPLEEIISPGESVLIVFANITRLSASGVVAQMLVRRLIQLGVAARDIRAIFATGIDRRLMPEEKRDLLSPFIAQRIAALDHDPFAKAVLVNLGETKHHLPIEVNRALLDHSHIILTGSVAFHSVLGFTGGRELICPGLCSARTIEALYESAFDGATGERRAGVGPGLLDGNVAHEECERVAAEVAPSFLACTIVNERGRPTSFHAGDWRLAHRHACAEYATRHTLAVGEKRPLVIASCGGDPFDLNLAEAYEALEMASRLCIEGGTIVLLAECSEGLGACRWMLRAWQRKAERYRIFLISDLKEEDVRRFGIRTATSLEEAMAQIEAKQEGFIVPHGAVFMPIIEARSDPSS